MNPTERAQFLLQTYSIDRAKNIIENILFDATKENDIGDIKYWTKVKKALLTLETKNEVEQ
jgi:hypothetical protein